MPNSNRGARTPIVGLIALVAISCLTTVLVADLLDRHRNTVQQYEANSSTHAAHAEDQIENCFSVAEDIGKAECIRKAVDAQSENERAEADLVAQREMSNWALGMLYVTMLMALVTGLGVYFVWRTLKATQQMAIDTRDIGEAQVRAYVEVSVASFSVPFPKPGKASVTFRVNNIGQSPAHNVSTSVAVFVGEKNFMEWCEAEAPDEPEQSNVIVPGRPIVVTATTWGDITEDEVLSITAVDPPLVLFAACEVTYTDVFKKRRRTTYLGSYVRFQTKGMGSLPTSYDFAENWAFTFVPGQNSAD